MSASFRPLARPHFNDRQRSCGGTTPEGKCEVNPETDCGWLLIYNKLKDQGALESLKSYTAPKEALAHPGQRTLSREGKEE